jgi:hypothetical protein
MACVFFKHSPVVCVLPLPFNGMKWRMLRWKNVYWTLRKTVSF